jgi:mannose-6-phosphate isomerase
MPDFPLYPLRFQPIFKDYLWGGRRLAEWFPSAPNAGPLAEAWLVSDEPANPSIVAEGPLQGRTLHDLTREYGRRLLGKPVQRNGRFPLLLKFLDAADALSVQVHPSDEQAAKISPEACGKTEAWVVLRAEVGSRIYAGLKPGVDERRIRQALAAGGIEDCLHSLTPKVGDSLLLPAGTVHALGAGLLIFEVQQTSDVTYRIHDWDRVDQKTGKSRPLHVEESLACTNFEAGPCHPVQPVVESAQSVARERLIDCPYFRLRRIRGRQPFVVGAEGECRILVGISGESLVAFGQVSQRLAQGDALLLPAEVGAGECLPEGDATVLECGLN